MTGSTQESISRMKVSEGRPRSDSSEPWDERGSAKHPAITPDDKNGNMRRDTYAYDEEELEDGDLPRLNLTRSTSNGEDRHRVAGRSASTSNSNNIHHENIRKMAGGSEELKKQQDFWKQLDSPSTRTQDEDDDTETDGSAGVRTRRRFEKGKVDVRRNPDDIVSGHPAPVRETREDRNKGPLRTKKEDSKRRLNGGEDPMEKLRIPESDDSDDTRDTKEYVDGEQEDTNFCDHTLLAMEAICGDSGLQVFCAGNGSIQGSSQPKDRVKNAKNLNILNARCESDSVDEHTAIEVEYVEPEETNGLSQERPENWSPSRKNAYLAVMARKAKEEFEKNQAKEMAMSSSPQRKQDSTEATSDATAQDVYNSFNAAEKRKFLRLINSGMSPTESAQRVRAERDKSKDSKPSKKGKLFKFWKKGKSKTNASVEKTISPTDRDEEGFLLEHSTQEEKKEDDRRDPRFQQQKAVPADSAGSSEDISGEGTEDSPSLSTYDKDVRNQEDDLSDSTSSAPKQAPVNTSGTLSNCSREPQSKLAAESVSSGDVSAPHAECDPAGKPFEAPAATTAGVASPLESPNKFSLSLDSNDDRADGVAYDGRFARSGINYYDAVRRELSESEDETEFSNQVSISSKTRSSNRSRLGPILNPKLKGFSKLSKGGRGNTDDRSTDKHGPSPRENSQHHNTDDLSPKVPSPGPKPQTIEPFGEGEEKQEIDAHDQDNRNFSFTQNVTEYGTADFDLPKRSLTESLNSASETPSKAEEAALERIEKELLRPVRNASSLGLAATSAVVSPDSSARTSTPRNDKMAEKLRDQILAVVSPDASQTTTASNAQTPLSQVAPASVASPVSSSYARSPVSSPPVPLASPRATDTLPKVPDGVDFDMQEYLNSTELYSQTAGHCNDSMSIASGKSFSTVDTGLHGAGSVYTQSSALTQSSRRRRPGAAKTRLAKAKQAEMHASKKKGWHESIRAAAETTNRVWKPNAGWVDYNDPAVESNTADLSSNMESNKKMHLNLPVGTGTKEKDGLSSDFTSHENTTDQKMPEASFQSVWEGETADILAEHHEQTNDITNGSPEPTRHLSMGSPNPVEAQGMASPLPPDGKSPETPSDHPALVPAGTLHSEKQWSTENASPMETTPPKAPIPGSFPTNIAPHNMTPNSAFPLSLDDMSVEESVAHSVDQFVQSLGAVSPPRSGRRKTAASPSRVQRLSTSPSKRSGWVDSMRAASASIGDEGQSWDPMSGWAANGPSLNEDFAPASTRFEQGTIDERQTEVSESSNDVAKSEASNRELSGEGIIATKENSKGHQQDEALRKGSVNPKTLDVHVHDHVSGFNEPVAEDTAQERDEPPPIDGAGGFPVESLDMTATVHVVKEKVDEEELMWFPQSRKSSLLVPKERDSMELSIQSSQASSQPSRRSHGPIDVDEAENFADDTEDPVVWNGVLFETDSNASVGNSTNLRTTSKSDASVSSKNSFSKLVPKLSKNRRDTSPIRGPKPVAREERSTFKTALTASPNQEEPQQETPNTSNSRLEPSAINSRSESKAASRSVFKSSNKAAVERNTPDQEDSRIRQQRTSEQTRVDSYANRDEQVTRVEELEAPDTPSSSVRLRAQQWEGRIPTNEGDDFDPRLNKSTAEWKAFLKKKVSAENEAAAEQKGRQRKHNHFDGKVEGTLSEYNDSIFEFSAAEGTADAQGRMQNSGDAKVTHGKDATLSSQHDSPQEQPAAYLPKQETEGAPTEISDHSDGNQIGKPFLARLAGCAAPMISRRGQGSGDAMGHLAFLRTNPQDAKAGNSRFMPQYLCGRPDVILEEAEGEGGNDYLSKEKKLAKNEKGPTNVVESRMQTQMMKDVIKAKRSEAKADTQSVISEDFGAKTAYLEALATKAAVSRPKSRRRGSSTTSEVSHGSSTSHKERWRDFLDRKAKAGASPGKSRANGSEASTAAENYAAKKVDELLAQMSRSKSTPRSWRSPNGPDRSKSRVVDDMIREHTRDSTRLERNSQQKVFRKSDSLVAAEQLASARVNAMMQALAKDNTAMEEGEI